MNLTGWANALGIHVQTACRWYREGTLAVPVQKAGRLILVSPESATEAARKTERAGLCARVSSDDQKSGLDDMVEILTWFCHGLYGRRPARSGALKAAGCGLRGIGPQAVKLQMSGGGA